MNSLSVETLRTWLEDERPITVLDVRPQADYQEWAIPTSRHIDAYEALKAHDPTPLAHLSLPKEIPVVTVCGAGKTSQIAAAYLSAQGFDAFSLLGGMKAWSLAHNVAQVPLPESQAQIIQLRRTGKGCLSYLIGVKQTAVVIDASLSPQVYLDQAKQRGWQIRHVMDTHIHADHLSRSRQLAQQSGAVFWLPEQERTTFSFTPLSDGETLDLEGVPLQVLSTPGHTQESLCYLLDQQALLTGDTLFLESVGRPDLEVSEGEVSRRAEQLYRSLHRLLSLEAHTLILPGHSSSPIAFDGRPLMATIAQIDEQVELLHLPRSAFLAQTLSRIPPTPPNYQRIVQANEEGVFPEEEVLELEAGANRCAIA